MILSNSSSYLGKVYRFFASFFRVDKKRKGKCIRCGMCCIKTGCKIIKFDNNGTVCCPIYKCRSLQCRKYPRTKKECFTESTCGYKFDQ